MLNFDEVDMPPALCTMVYCMLCILLRQVVLMGEVESEVTSSFYIWMLVMQSDYIPNGVSSAPVASLLGVNCDNSVFCASVK